MGWEGWGEILHSCAFGGAETLPLSLSLWVPAGPRGASLNKKKRHPALTFLQVIPPDVWDWF